MIAIPTINIANDTHTRTLHTMQLRHPIHTRHITFYQKWYTLYSYHQAIPKKYVIMHILFIKHKKLH